MISLSENNSELTIDPKGGRIVELILDSTPLLGTFTRIDGKEANTHICAPNFGSEGVEKYNLPAHGPGRSAVWSVASEADNSLTIIYDVPKIGTYPTTLSIAQTFVITDREFSHRVLIANTGNKEAPVNCALHYYFHTPQGWDSLAINGVNRADKIKEDTSIDAEQENIISISGNPPFVITVGDDFGKLQTWTARQEKNGKKEYSQDFACIEPAIGTEDYFNSSESIISSGETKTLACTISLQS